MHEQQKFVNDKAEIERMISPGPIDLIIGKVFQEIGHLEGWLFLVDDVQDPAVLNLFPTGKGRIIFTTSVQPERWDMSVPVTKHVAVGPLLPSDALSLVEAMTAFMGTEEFDPMEKEKFISEALHRNFNRMPLQIKLFGRYVASRKLKVAEVIEGFALSPFLLETIH